jgi:hypothetical protein
MKLILQFIFFLCLFSNCSSPSPDPTTPKGAYTLHINSLENQNYGKVYELLYSKVREQIDETYRNLKAAESRIMTEYPAALRETSLKELGDKKFREAKDEKEFFIVLLSSSKRPVLSLREKIGIRVKSTRETNGTVELRTMAGESYNFILESGVYHFIPSDEDIRSINAALLKSREVLLQVNENIKKIKDIK